MEALCYHLFTNLLLFPGIPAFPRFIWALVVAASLRGVSKPPCGNVICWDQFSSPLVFQAALGFLVIPGLSTFFSLLA